MTIELIHADWPASSRIKAFTTTRKGGISKAPFDSLNLGAHVGDVLANVEHNRAFLEHHLALNEPLTYLEQIHGTQVEVLHEPLNVVPKVDAAVTVQKHLPCTVMTADCLPVLFCDRNESVVAAAHAGWRGLLDGVLEATVSAMKLPASELMVWMGPAIGPQAFEVGGELQQAFVAQNPQALKAFIPQGEKYLADIYHLARLRLHAMGISEIYGGQHCTYSEPEHFFSYRRDGQTGRMASVIYMEL